MNSQLDSPLGLGAPTPCFVAHRRASCKPDARTVACDRRRGRTARSPAC
jgi:hypothetical protein